MKKFKKVVVNESTGVVEVTLKSKKFKRKGVAKCNFDEKDVFNKEAGISIATLRAKIAFKNKQQKDTDKKVKSLKNEINYLEILSKEKDIEIKTLENQLKQELNKLLKQELNKLQ